MKSKLFRLAVLVSVFAMLMSATLPAFADDSLRTGDNPLPESSANGVYIVQMLDNPAVAYRGGIPGYQATKPAKGKKIEFEVEVPEGGTANLKAEIK